MDGTPPTNAAAEEASASKRVAADESKQPIWRTRIRLGGVAGSVTYASVHRPSGPSTGQPFNSTFTAAIT